MAKLLQKLLLSFLLISALNGVSDVRAQFFSSGPIPMCDTSIFTCNVNGIGTLYPYSWSPYGYYLVSVGINITSNHPQTLKITLTSPQGTTILLSAFNGAGGVNYTGTVFGYTGPNITTGSAPFTGNWLPQTGSLSAFDWEYGDGIWKITVIDTACGVGGTGPGGPWTPGTFNGGIAGGGMVIGGWGFPTCYGWIPDNTALLCPGESVDIIAYYMSINPFLSYSVTGTATPSNVTTAGSYQVDGFDYYSGCIYSAIFTVIVYNPAPSLGPDLTISGCAGTPVNLNALFPGSGAYSPHWTFNGSYLSMLAANSASNSGTYTIYAASYSTCADTAVVNLTMLPPVSLGPDQTISACTAGTYDLTTLYNTTGLTAGWTLGGVPVANPAAVAAGGTYVLIASAGGNCGDTAEVNLTLSAPPSLGPDQTQSICSGATLDLTALYATGANTPAWYFGGAPYGTPAAATASGVYTLVVTAPGGCTDTALVTVNVSAAPALGPDQNQSVCGNDPIDLTALYTTTGFTTSWTLGGTPVANPSAVTTGGVYTLIADPGSACADTALVTVTALATPALGPDLTTAVCSGSSLNLNSLYTTTGLTTSWTSGGAPVANPTAVTTAGGYTLIATSAAGCSDTALVTLSVTNAPALGANQLQSICTNDPLDLTTLYTTTGFTTSWTLGGTPVANPSAVTTGGVYTLIADPGSACADTALVTVTALATPALGADQITGICSGNAADLTTLFVTTGYTTAWTIGGVPVANPAAVTAAGVYTLIATSAAGCSDTALVTVNVGATPVIGASQQVTACDNTTIDLTSLYVTTGLTAVWTSAGNPVAAPGAVSTSGIYTLTVTNPAGCTATAAVTATFNSAPDLGPDQSLTLCPGTSGDLTALFNLSGLTAVWTASGAPVADPANVTAAGTYQLIVTNVSGCTDTALTTVTQTTGPTLGPDQSFALCGWMTIDLSTVFNTSGLTATYTLGGQPVANYTAVYDSGMYTVTVTDANGCTASANAIVTNITCLCTADFFYSGRCMQEPFAFEAVSDSLMLGAHWSFGSSVPEAFVPDPSVKFNSPGNLLVTLEASLTCGVVTVNKYVTVDDCSDSCHFYMPTAFTPNSDGHNDHFGWQGECTPESYTLEIYNRFGQVIFKTNNPLASWDGTYNSSIAPSGVYVYQVEYKLPYQFKQVKSGRLSVIR